MPLPTDEKLLALSQDLLKQFDTLFGLHPGFRAAHARGTMLSGTFTPDAEAVSLTKAPHITRSSTPVTARFSNSTGVPLMPDNDPNANPRGLAIRFHLAEHVHTDIVSHSTDGFPARTGENFRSFCGPSRLVDRMCLRQNRLSNSSAHIRQRLPLSRPQNQVPQVSLKRLIL